MIIGLAGPGGVGKTTTVRAMEMLEPRVRLVSISGPLKDMLRAFYRSLGLDRDAIARRLDGDLKREPDPLLGGRTPTHAMQTLGTEWGRDLIHPDLWLNTWRSRVANLSNSGLIPVNDSIRFCNEATACDIVVRLVGSGNLAPEHASERQEFPVTCTIVRDAEPEEIARRVLTVAGL